MLGTSQVLLLLSFSRDELKSDKPNGDQTVLNSLSCVDIAFGKDCQEKMNVQSQLLLLGVLPKHYKLWWQNGSRLTDWFELQHTRKCPTPVLPLREGTRCAHKTIPQKK